MKISAVVVTFNEENFLDECLQSLTNCSQLLVVDLGSSDRSVEIAQKYTTQIIQHERVEIAEFILPDILALLENDWFIRVDPDEVVPLNLLEEIVEFIEKTPEAAIVEIPFQYYFLRKPLHTTVWGGVRPFPKVLNTQRVMIHKRVHGAFEIRDGYFPRELPYNGKNAVKHYWIDSYASLIEKHERYLRLEGKSRYERGQRFTWKSWVAVTARAFMYSLVKKQGWRGGWQGWFLSFFFAQYESRAWLAIRAYQMQLAKQP